LSSIDIDRIRQSLSPARLASYGVDGDDEITKITNYVWNLRLSEALYPGLHAAEVSLRNSIHEHVSSLHGPMWFYVHGLLEPGQLKQFANAVAFVAGKKPRRDVTDGRLVAELNFGFWVSLLSGRYDQRLWAPRSYELLDSVFPNRDKHLRHEIGARFALIEDLRNRVFHHEPIWRCASLAQEYADIREAIRWINPGLSEALLDDARFEFVKNGRNDLRSTLTSQIT